MIYFLIKSYRMINGSRCLHGGRGHRYYPNQWRSLPRRSKCQGRRRRLIQPLSLFVHQVNERIKGLSVYFASSRNLSVIMAHTHSHDGINFHASHSHEAPAADHAHTHEILDGPGSYMGREMPIIEGRDWSERAFTVGIGG